MSELWSEGLSSVEKVPFCVERTRTRQSEYTHKTSEVIYGTAVCSTRSEHVKGSKERLFIMTQTHSLHILEVIPFVKLQYDT